MKTFRKFSTITSQVLYLGVVVAVLALALLFVGTKVDLFGYEVKIVKSGSMEPAILTGGVVIVSPEPVYAVGDVVTYGKNRRNQLSVTHRIIETEGAGNSATFITKGDANEDRDPKAVPARDVIGKVQFSVPYLGYVIEFARTPLGFMVLIGIPALFIVLDEIANIVWEVRLGAARKRRFEQKGAREHGRMRTQHGAPKSTQTHELVVARTQRTGFDLHVKPYREKST